MSYSRKNNLLLRISLAVIVFHLTAISVYTLFKRFHGISKNKTFLNETSILIDEFRELNICPPFEPGVGFTDRITYVDASGEKCLNPREICSIESLATSNPHMTLYIYLRKGPILKEKRNIKVRSNRNCDVTEVLRRFQNVKFIYKDFLLYLYGTKFEVLAQKLFQNSSIWSEAHLEDAVKLALLYRHGGVYLAGNFLGSRPFHCLSNAIIFQGEDVDRYQQQKTNGVVIMDKGHPFLKFALRYLAQNYDPNLKNTLGMSGIIEVLKLYCHMTNNSSMSSNTFTCYNGTELNNPDSKLFFPLLAKFTPYLYSHSYLEAPQIDLTKIKNSFLINIYGAEWNLPLRSSALYAELAKQRCPLTWETVFAINDLEF